MAASTGHVYPDYPDFVKKKLNQNGYYNRTPEERVTRIKKALAEWDKSVGDLRFKGSALDGFRK